jgi:hypothetical protein
MKFFFFASRLSLRVIGVVASETVGCVTIAGGGSELGIKSCMLQPVMFVWLFHHRGGLLVNHKDRRGTDWSSTGGYQTGVMPGSFRYSTVIPIQEIEKTFPFFAEMHQLARQWT